MQDTAAFAARKPINLRTLHSYRILNAKSRPELCCAATGGLLPPQLASTFYKVLVGLQSHNAPVRYSGHRENLSCTAFADKFRVFSFDFIGLQPTYGMTGRYFGPRHLSVRKHVLLAFTSPCRLKKGTCEMNPSFSRLHTCVIKKLHLQIAVDSDLIGLWSAKHDFNSVKLPKKRKTFSCVITGQTNLGSKRLPSIWRQFRT